MGIENKIVMVFLTSLSCQISTLVKFLLMGQHETMSLTREEVNSVHN